MNLNEFKVWVRRRLGDDGACTVSVELTDGQIGQALDDASLWWNSSLGLYREQILSFISGQGEYDLSSVLPGVDKVVSLWPPRRKWEIDFRDLYPGFLDVNVVPYNVGMMFGSAYPQTTIAQTLQTIESTERIVSSDLSWDFYSENLDDGTRVRKLRVYPSPTYSGTGIYLYRVDPKDIKLKNYSQRDLFLIRDYALALCKEMLGRIRSKYQGLPAAGGDRSLDGEALLAESRDDIAKLEEKILQHDGPIAPVIG